MRIQCKLLGVARSTVTYKPAEEAPEDIRIKRLLDEICMKDLCFVSRRLVTVLKRDYNVKTGSQAGRSSAPRDGPGDDLVQALDQHS